MGRGLGVEHSAVIEEARADVEGGGVVVVVRPTKGNRHRCGHCQRRSPRYEAREGRRRWRSLDAGAVMVFIEADAPRVSCRDDGVTVAAVPWARHGAGAYPDLR